MDLWGLQARWWGSFVEADNEFVIFRVERLLWKG